MCQFNGGGPHSVVAVCVNLMVEGHTLCVNLISFGSNSPPLGSAWVLVFILRNFRSAKRAGVHLSYLTACGGDRIPLRGLTINSPGFPLVTWGYLRFASPGDESLPMFCFAFEDYEIGIFPQKL